MLFSCSSSNDALTESSDAIVGNWSLESQLINGQETINDCNKQTLFSFESGRILRQQFYSMPNTICVAGNQIISTWLHIGDSKYEIVSSSQTTRVITVTFSENNTKFSLTETDSNNKVTTSIFKKN